jgi:uncharacterized protein (DUF427 family)
MKAIWNGKVIAESDNVETVEGNSYFPPESIRRELFKPTETKTVCPWKGTANYYSIELDGQTNTDAAWTYPEPKAAAENIRNHFAFWRGVEIVDN